MTKRKATHIDMEQISEAFSGTKQIMLIAHYNPDGDAIGSMLALYHFLKKKGHKLAMMVPNDYPEFLKWMKGSENIWVYFHHQKRVAEFIDTADIIVAIDFNEPKRLKEAGELIDKAKCLKIMFDHHPEPHSTFAYKVFNTAASSTAELVYEYIITSGGREQLDETIAECIFTGIMSDTGNFSHNSSNGYTYHAVATLMDCGIDKDQIFDNFYNNFSEKRMRLMGHLLNDNMVVLPELHTAYITLSKEEQDKYAFAPGDSEGLVNMPFSIKGVNIVAFFTEKKDHIRISFRSRGAFAINEKIAKHFEGGGHHNAAGGESKTDMTTTIKKFEELIIQHKDEIKSIYNIEK
jgi:bifunctional oligoribonuclease and PAP phosphatase NrnA